MTNAARSGRAASRRAVTERWPRGLHMRVSLLARCPVAVVVSVAGLLTLAPVRAVGEVGGPGAPTVQARAADATWLAYTPPPVAPGIVCMVDSGVDPNPDTEAAVIGGQALAPETGTNDEIARLGPRVQPGDHPDGHGTVMAMVMAAPRNGWGMVGLAPTSVRVYNMKAVPRGAVTFPFAYYAVGIEECRQLHGSRLSTLNVINLSLGGTSEPAGAELAVFQRYVASAHESGLVLVAAAGNAGGPILYPAADAGVLAVAAGDAAGSPGSLCSFASRGEGLGLVAPGCDSMTGGLEVAFEDDGTPAVGSGSSQASALVAATLASMRAYDPLLTWSQAEACVAGGARDGSLDVRGAFDACGLASIVSAGEAAERAAEPPPAPAVGQARPSEAPAAASAPGEDPALPAIKRFEHGTGALGGGCRARSSARLLRSHIRSRGGGGAKGRRGRRSMPCRKCASLSSGRRSPASSSRCSRRRRRMRAHTRSKRARRPSAT